MNKLDISELSTKYRLPEWTVWEEIERAVSKILSGHLGFEVEAFLNENDILDLWGFVSNHGDLEVKRFNADTIPRSLLQKIKHGIAEALMLRSVLNEYDLVKHRTGSIIFGTIIRTLPCGMLHVDVELGSVGDTIVALCDLESQTPKEMGEYRQGTTLPFHIKNIRPVMIKDIPRLEVRMSRNARGLVEGLLNSELKDRKMDIQVKCTRRIAGAFSDIKSPKRIPRDCIKKISDELKERIIVAYEEKG